MNRIESWTYKKWLAQVIQKDTLTKREIEQILDGQLELPEKDINGDLVQECLLFLYPEYENGAMPEGKKSREKIETFLERVREEEKRRIIKPDKNPAHFRISPTVLVVSVLMGILLIGTAIANSLGFDIWNYVFHWDSGTLSMGISMRGQQEGDEPPKRIGIGRDDAFDQKLAEFEMYPSLPSWLPDGFILKSVEASIDNEHLSWVLGTYADGERQLQVTVDKNTAECSINNLNIEKDEQELEIYKQNGTEFFIVDNLTRAEVYWVEPPYLLNVGGNISRDDLTRVIDSIYERRMKK